jgi:uncharacterized lipoprotein YddW (UPF0748 family)
MLAPPARVHDRSGRLRFLLSVAIAAALVVPSAGIQHAQSAPAEVRALWVTRASLTSPASIASLVDSASASGFNTLLVQVRGRGDAYFSNSIEPRADALTGQPVDFDPLDVVLRRAHAQGLRVHAWVDVNLISSATEFASSRSHIVCRHPDWLMVPRALAYDLGHTDVRSPEYVGKLARWTRAADDVEGLFASPILADAANHVIRVVDDLAQRYPVDGVHLDYIRYPGPQFDYSLGALQAFRQDLDAGMTPAERRRFDPSSVAALIAATDTYPDRWAGFRRSRLNTLLIRLRTVVKQRRPDAIVSAAVYPDAQEAATYRFQDWSMWVENRWLDVVCPMVYTPDARTFATQVASVRQVAGTRQVWAGIGAYRLSAAQTVDNILTARKLGANGIVLFSYDSLVHPPRGTEYLTSVSRDAFTQ